MKKKPFWEMSPKELADATKQFEEPSAVDHSRPLAPEERAHWSRIKRKRGRPKVGRGHKRVSISIEQGLLKRINAYAKKQGISRSGLIADAFEKLLSRKD